jgi:hypothetical protein
MIKDPYPRDPVPGTLGNYYFEFVSDLVLTLSENCS